jgi:hypothetical protein
MVLKRLVVLRRVNQFPRANGIPFTLSEEHRRALNQLSVFERARQQIPSAIRRLA